jgi:hypothetical protein
LTSAIAGTFDVISVMRRRGALALALAMVVGTTACGGDGDDALFRTDQLAELVARSEDAPPNMSYDEDQSGPAPVELLSQGVGSAQSRFEQLGFLGGQSAVFVSPNEGPPPAGTVIGSGVFLFEDSSAASEALDVHRSVVIPEVMQGPDELPADDLGDEAFGFTFASGPAGGPGAIYVFRIANAVFLVPGSGPSAEPEQLLALARTVADRADEQLA